MVATSRPRSVAGSSDPVLTDLIDEVSRQLEAGELVDLDAFIAAHPEREEKLRLVLPALAVLADLGRSASREPSSAVAAADSLGDLGDYRIVREIGRGGMGVVYEAIQISLNRRVALKVLPFAGALDAHHLARFRLEAQAAAQLHHTNIVPVFAVGSERGVHYYAMQYIEGKTLADLIRELGGLKGPDHPGEPEDIIPSPLEGEGGPEGRMRGSQHSQERGSKSTSPPSPRTRAFFRTVATLGIQAADALEHAHRHGILHRDIKPANLLVDVQGNLWITDFGLARDGDDASLTLSGDVLGTLRYMSPEQALSRRAIVDQRTDIYSLGVTLYETLTLRSPFEGRDRQETLRKISEDEPRPPRLLNRSIPRDLETIVLKAISRDVSDRYATAEDLADDLRRFLDHRPIRARRPSLWVRSKKLARRHRVAVISLSSLLVLGGLAAGVMVAQQRHNQDLRRSEQGRRYADDVKAASSLIGQCRLKEARDLLVCHIPQPGAEDLRSFPWFHLWRVCHYQPEVWPGHSDSRAKAIYHLELSLRGDVLASSGEDGTVRLWDTETGRLLQTLRGHKGDVNWVAFSPDGSKLATGGDDGTVRLWPLSGNPQPITLGKHDHWVTCVLFTLDGLKVISGALDGRLKTWDVKRRRLLASTPAHGGGIEGMALSPDGRTLATGGHEGNIRTWDTGSLEMVRELGSFGASVQSVAFSHDGLFVSGACLDGTVERWELATGTGGLMGTTSTRPGKGGAALQCVAFSRDDRTAACCGDDGSVRLWNSDTGDTLQIYRAEAARLWCVAFSPDGRTLFSCGADGLIRRWHLENPQDRWVIQLPSVEVQSIAFAEGEGRLLAASRSADASDGLLSITAWEFAGNAVAEVSRVDLGKHFTASTFSADGSRLVTLDQRGRLAVWDSKTGRAIRQILLPGSHTEPGFPSGLSIVDSLVCVKSPTAEGTWAVWDTETDRLDYRPDSFVPLALLRSSQEVFVRGDPGTALWNPSTGTVRSSGAPTDVSPTFLRRSHDGRLLAGDFGTMVCLLDARTAGLEGKLLGHERTVDDLDFSPDDRVIASVAQDGTLKLWDSSVHLELDTLLTQIGLGHVRFSPDGSYLVCAIKGGIRRPPLLIIWRAAPSEGGDRSAATWKRE
jgi:WD40 repeat protein/serine/threonine protein kinase